MNSEQRDLMEKLEYSEISGCFTWSVDPRGKPGLKGKKAGFLVNGYTLIKTTIGGKKANFLHTGLHGFMPTGSGRIRK